MKISKYVVLLALMSFSIADLLNGALPPLYQTAGEIEAIVKNKDLDKVLPSGEPITGIIKNESGYLISTPRYQVQAQIIYKSQPMPGPAQYDIKLHPAQYIDASGEQ